MPPFDEYCILVVEKASFIIDISLEKNSVTLDDPSQPMKINFEVANLGKDKVQLNLSAWLFEPMVKKW
jgi:hypothetical protein